MDTDALPKTKTEKPLANKKASFPKVIDESFAKPAPAAAAAATTTKASSSTIDQPQVSPNQTSKTGSRSKCAA